MMAIRDFMEFFGMCILSAAAYGLACWISSLV
jgi:hypothetical protein